MQRREFLTALATGAASLTIPSFFSNAHAMAKVKFSRNLESKNISPNIIFIMADDLGYGDLGCFGNPYVQSKNIDKLAYDNQVLTQYYTGGPVCMPSRVALLTGRYPYNAGSRMSQNSTPPSLKVGFFPKILKQAGYSTSVMGKWHLGHFPEGMETMGFDEWSICAPGGWCDYWDYTIHTQNGNSPSNGKYSTDMITEAAIDFIAKKKHNPFFMYIAYTAPHFPLQAPDEDVLPFKDFEVLPDGTKIVYGMIRRMDIAIGKIIEKLNTEGIYDNTMIVFTSDNGPRFGAYNGLDQNRYNGNLAGQKGYTLEGGIKVPAIIKWPSRYQINQSTYPYIMSGVDWFATLLAVAGVKMPDNLKIDGDNYLLELLKCQQKNNIQRFWSYNKVRPTNKSNSAMIDGHWKLNRPAIEEFNSWETPADAPLPENIPDYQLYRLDVDPYERVDISDQYPQKRAEMINKFQNWFDSAMKEYDRLNSN